MSQGSDLNQSKASIDVALKENGKRLNKIKRLFEKEREKEISVHVRLSF